jgi:hypothetical protein
VVESFGHTNPDGVINLFSRASENPELRVHERGWESPLRKAQRTYAQEFENAYVRTRATGSISQMTSYDPADLGFLDESMLDMDRQATEGYAARAALTQARIDEADRLARNQVRAEDMKRGLGQTIINNLIGQGAASLILPDPEDTEQARVQSAFEEQYAKLFEEYRAGIEGSQVDDRPNWGAFLMAASQGVWGWAATLTGNPDKAPLPTAMQVLDKIPAAMLLGPSALTFGGMGEPTKIVGNQKLQEQADARFAQNLAVTADVSFEEMTPEAQTFLLEAAGGDYQLASAFLLDGFLGNQENMDEVQQMRQQAFDQENDVYYKALEENQFRADYSTLDLMDDWGRLTGGLAVGAGLLLSDDDIREMVADGEFRAILDEIAEYDAQPSAIWGLEGTFFGLGIDFGLMTIFDPTTWVFAPAKGAAALRQFATADNVMGLVNSRTGRQVFDSLVSSTQRGGRAMLSATEWMPDNQMMQFHRAVQNGNLDKAKELFTEAILLGGEPGQVDNLMWAQYRGNVVKATLDDPGNDIVETARRFTSSVSNRTSVELYGSSMTNDVLETFATLFSDDLSKFDEFSNEFMGIASEVSLRHSDDVDILRQATADLTDEVRIYSQLAEGNIRPLVEGFTIGGQPYDTLDQAIQFLARKASTGTADDATRLFQQRELLEGIKRRIDGRSADELRLLADYTSQPTDDFVRAFGGKDIQPIDPLPAPGMRDGIGKPHVAEDGSQLTLPLYRSEQLVGRIVLDYDNDKLVNLSIATSKTHKGDGLTLFRAARKLEPQLDPYWLANNVTKLAPEMSDDGARFIQSIMRKEAEAIGSSAQARTLLSHKMPRLQATSNKLVEALQGLGDPNQRKRMGDLILRTYEDYVKNDSILSRIPGLLDEKGAVQWEILRSNAPWRRGQQRRIDPAAGRDLPPTIKKVLTPQTEGMSVNLPISPIDLLVARSIFGRILRGNMQGKNRITRAFFNEWNKWGRRKLQDSAGRWYEAGRRFFLFDKVMRPSTAAVAHLDEYYRIIHDYGVRGLQAWADRNAARAVRTVDYGLRRISGGHANLGPVSRIAESRLRRFKEAVPRELHGRQSSMFQATGEVFRDIPVGSWEHESVAKGLTDFFLEDPGFLQWRAGGFDTFWDSQQNWMRNQLVQDHITKVSRPMTKEDAISNYENIWEWLTRNPKNPARTDAAWAHAVEQSIKRGRSVGLPQYVLRELGPLPGWAQDPQAFNAFQGVRGMLDTLFLQPQAGRQELISVLERTRQMKRLESLMDSQGYRILEPDQYEQMAVQMGFEVPLSRATTGFLDERLVGMKVVPRTYLENLADRSATRAVDRIMYSWHLDSPAGLAARHVAPFGKPWADMWSYYLNRVFSKPVLRGHFIGENHPRISGWIDQALRHYPVPILPNRTTALVSRVAALDFELENQNLSFRVPWPLSVAFGDDVDIEGLDLGAATFLPHRGENPFFSLLPGLGVIPTVFIDYFVPDPAQSPEEYNAFERWMRDELPGFFPTVEYGSPSPLGRFLGGGWVSSFMRMAAATGLRTGGQFPAPWSLMEFIGDTQGSTQAVRSIKGILGTQEAWEELLAYGQAGTSEKDLVNQLLQAFAYTALEEAGEALLQRTLLRQVVPSRFNTDPTLEDLEEIWLEAGKIFPTLLPEREGALLAARPEDENARADAASAIRNTFYNLPVSERDKLILQFPGLVPQLVSGWTWNTLKVDEIPELEGSTPFQHFPGNVGAEKFEQYKKLGWLVPRPAKDVLLSAIGYYFVVQDRAARNIYSEAVQWIMENRPEDADFLNDGEPLNDQWRSNNVIEGSGGFPAYIREYVFTVPAAQLSEEARLLGVDLGDSYTGAQLIEAIQGKLAQNRENPLHSLTVGRYLNEADFRGAAQDQALAQIAMVSPGDDQYPDQWVDFLRALQDDMRVASQFYEDPREDPNIQQDITTLRDAYAWMAHSYPGFAWKTTWDQAFADDFGVWPDDWEPPTPPSGHPREANGFQPYVWNVIDGDSMEVSQNANQGTTFSPMLLPGPEFTVGDEQGRPQAYGARLIGLRAPEYSTDPEAAEAAHRELFNMLQRAPAGSIWLVPDPRFPEIDQFGRRLVWLWVNGQYIYNPEDFRPTDDIAFDLAGTR